MNKLIYENDIADEILELFKSIGLNIKDEVLELIERDINAVLDKITEFSKVNK